MNKNLLLGAIILSGVILVMSNKSKMKISDAGLNKLKKFEGLELCPYLDSAGKITIGYGHLILPHEKHLLTGCITEPEAERLLRNDVKTAEKYVNKYVDVPLSQNEFDALVSFVYNVGGGAFKASTMLKRLNSGNKHLAADEFERWIYAGGVKSKGLLARRMAEKKTFIG